MSDVAKISLFGASAFGAGYKTVAASGEEPAKKGAGAFGAGFPTEITPITGSPKVGGVEGVGQAGRKEPSLDNTFWTAVRNNFYTHHSSENKPKPEGIYGTDYGVPTTKATQLYMSA